MWREYQQIQSNQHILVGFPILPVIIATIYEEQCFPFVLVSYPIHVYTLLIRISERRNVKTTNKRQ